jgi:hypothetical protein
MFVALPKSHYVDELRTNTTATGSWTIYRWGWQLSGTPGLDEAYVPLFGAFGAARDDAMVARWCARCCGRRSTRLTWLAIELGG